MKTLEQILEKEKAHRREDGPFGINACKEHIKWWSDHFHDPLERLLDEYIERANNDAFFNNAMVLACWELIKGVD